MTKAKRQEMKIQNMSIQCVDDAYKESTFCTWYICHVEYCSNLDYISINNLRPCTSNQNLHFCCEHLIPFLYVLILNSSLSFVLLGIFAFLPFSCLLYCKHSFLQSTESCVSNLLFFFTRKIWTTAHGNWYMKENWSYLSTINTSLNCNYKVNADHQRMGLHQGSKKSSKNIKTFLSITRISRLN